MTVDLTVAVTAHSETLVAGPAMRSADAAIAVAEAEGARVERLIALDAPSADCRAFFAQPAFGHWTSVDLDFNDLGRTRNAVVQKAGGRWIAFLDADDLFGDNWLAAAAKRLRDAERAGENIVVHPELNWTFDNEASVHLRPDQDDPFFTPLLFYCVNYYDSLCMAPREAALEIPYRPYDMAKGLAFEGWPWIIETMAAGWRHVIARDTVIFKRRRDSSLVVDSARRRTLIPALEPMAIDRVRDLRPSRTALPPARIPPLPPAP